MPYRTPVAGRSPDPPKTDEPVFPSRWRRLVCRIDGHRWEARIVDESDERVTAVLRCSRCGVEELRVTVHAFGAGTVTTGAASLFTYDPYTVPRYPRIPTEPEPPEGIEEVVELATRRLETKSGKREAETRGEPR